MRLTLALAILAIILWVGTYLALIPLPAAAIATLVAIVVPSFERWRHPSR